MSDELFIYFDGVSAYGQVNGAIQIELGANVLDGSKEGAVEVRHVTTARLRCSPAAAADLLQATTKALEMLQNPGGAPAAKGTIN